MEQQWSQLQMHLGQPAANDKYHCSEDEMFLRAHRQQCTHAAGTLFFFGIWEFICAATRGASLNGCPGHCAEQGTEWAAASSSGETATLGPMLQNIVYTSVILPTPWARREQPPLPFSPSPPSPPCCLLRSQPSCPYYFSPSRSVSLIITSFPFFSYTKI